MDNFPGSSTDLGNGITLACRPNFYGTEPTSGGCIAHYNNNRIDLSELTNVRNDSLTFPLSERYIPNISIDFNHNPNLYDGFKEEYGINLKKMNDFTETLHLSRKDTEDKLSKARESLNEAIKERNEAAVSLE